MNPIIKWPGGKKREIDKIEHLIPDYKRYIEPFFGGGALFFHLRPKEAAINDVSESLIQFYQLIKKQDEQLHQLLISYNESFRSVVEICAKKTLELTDIFFKLKKGAIDNSILVEKLIVLVDDIIENIDAVARQRLILDSEELKKELLRMTKDKYFRTIANYNKKPYSPQDLSENLITGFTSGYYMYFRKVFNDICLGRRKDVSEQYRAANFYFVREYCYGSMFRYNAKGEFNIPYGGMSYNKKNINNKIDSMFNSAMERLFENVEIHCSDFERFFSEICVSKDDFMFLDPPYDTDFSDYEGKNFTKEDQERLSYALKKTPAKFLLVIKNTQFIKSLYEKDFYILSFDKQYTYNVRSRNDRDVKHLIITNYPVR